MNRLRLFAPLALILVVLGCAHGRVVNGTFVSDDYRFSVTLPGPPYEQISAKDALVALTDPGTGASIAIAVGPSPYADGVESEQALDFVTRGLFFFLTQKDYRVFEDATLGGVPARHAVLTGREDDTQLIFAAYTALSSGLIYDIVMWCDPQEFDAVSPVFEKMVGTFTFSREADK